MPQLARPLSPIEIEKTSGNTVCSETRISKWIVWQAVLFTNILKYLNKTLRDDWLENEGIGTQETADSKVTNHCP